MPNIDTSRELNKILSEQNKLFQVQAKVMKGQLMTMKAMVETLGNVPVKETSQAFQDMNDALGDADKALDEFGKGGQEKLGNINKSLKESAENTQTFADRIEDLGKKSAIFAIFVDTLSAIPKTFKLAVSLTKSLIGVTATLISTFKDLAFAIISVPFKMLNAMMDYAANTSGAEFRRQIEEVRGEFGSLAKNEARAVIKAFRNIRGTLAETGLSTYRVLGWMAERLQAVRELAVKLGRQFTIMQGQFMKHAERIVAYEKGLGLTEDGIKNVAMAATALTKDFIEVGREITTYAYQMGKAFNINGKLIARDIGEMIGDFENFGSIGVKQMSQVAVFTRKLGIEIKDLLGIVGKFDDFEDAAQAAAQLSQAFGMNVDALRMIKEQDPAARFEMIRKSFKATGKDINALTRQELKLLSTHTGLDAKTLKLGLSSKGMAQSYGDIQKQAAETEKKQLSQAQAMKELADSIKLLVKEGQKMQGGFFDIFMQGFEFGIERSREFRRTIWTLRRAMRAVRRAGIQTGRAFVRLFPGIKKVFEGFRDLFDPKVFGRVIRGSGKVTGLMGAVVKMFREFFKIMTTDPKVALETLMKKLQKTFFEFFQKESAPGRKLLTGFKTFFEKMSGLFVAFTDIAMKGITKGLEMIVDLIANPERATGPAAKYAKGFLGWLQKTIFFPLLAVWETNKKPLGEAIVKLFDTVWKMAKPKVIKYGKLAGEWVIKGFVIATATNMAFRAITGSLLFLLGKGVAALAERGSFLLPRVASVFESIFMGGARKAAQTAGPATGKIMGDVIGKGASAAQKGTVATKGMTAGGIKAMGAKLLAMGAALLIGGVAIAGAIWAIRKALKNLKKEEIPVILGALGTSIVGMIGMAPILMIMSKIPWRALSAGLGKAAVGVAAMAGLSLVMSVNFLAIAGILSSIKEGEIKKIEKIMKGMALLYMAAGVIIIEALVAGLAVAGPQGLLVAAGISAMAAAIILMSGHAIAIIKSINKIKMGTDLERKVNIFTKVIKTITEFGRLILDIMKASTSVFTGLRSIFSDEPQQSMRKTLGLVQKIIVAMTDNVKKIIDKIIQATQTLTVSDVRKGEFLGGILSATAEVAQALVPPPELVDPGFFASLIKPDQIETIKRYMGSASIQIQGLIEKMQGMFLVIGSLPKSLINIESIKAFSILIQGTGALINALSPSKGFLNLINKMAIAEAHARRMGKKVARGAASPMVKAIKDSTEFISAMMNALIGPEGAFKKVKKFIKSLSKSMEGIDVAAVETSMEMFNNVVKTLTALGGFMMSEEFKKLEAAGIQAAAKSFQNVTTDLLGMLGGDKGIPAFLKDLKRNVPILRLAYVNKVASGVTDLVTQVNNISSELQKLDSIKLIKVETKLEGLAEKLGLKGTEKLKINLNDINVNLNVEVNLMVDDITEGIKTRPGPSQFVFSRNRR